jgi:hypothetical protein
VTTVWEQFTQEGFTDPEAEAIFPRAAELQRQGEHGIACTEHTGEGLAPRPGAPVHAPSMRLGPPGLHALKPVAPPVAVDLSGAELTRDGGVEATPPRPGLVPAGLIPNRPATRRHRTPPTRGRRRVWPAGGPMGNDPPAGPGGFAPGSSMGN